MERALKIFLILFFVTISLFGLIGLSVDMSVKLYSYSYDLRPIVYAYSLFVISLLTAIQIARIIEGIAYNQDVPFLLTVFFSMEDEPKKDPVKDPLSFIALILLLLGGYIIRPVAFLIGILRLSKHRNELYFIKLINSAIILYRLILVLVLIPLGLIYIEKRYVSRD